MSSDLEALKHELRRADLFLDWDDLLLELVASICQIRTYKRGEVIFEEGSNSDELYLVADGAVDIRVRDLSGNDSYTIATLRRGQNFGEVALLDEGRRTAAAVCAESNTELIVIPSDKIALMCENVPKLGYLLMKNIAADLAMKIRNTDIEISARLTWSPSQIQ